LMSKEVALTTPSQIANNSMSRAVIFLSFSLCSIDFTVTI